jgi:hypothetical protein
MFMQGTLSSILAIRPNHFNVADLIIFIMLNSLYKIYSSKFLYFPYTFDTVWAINFPYNLPFIYALFLSSVFMKVQL